MKDKKSSVDNLLDIVFPRKCVACGEYLYTASFICEKCNERLYLYDYRTQVPKIILDGYAAAYFYDGAARDAMLRLKFGSNIGVAPFFAETLQREVQTQFYGIDFDIVTCVPSTRKSLNERGFNQAQVIAEDLKVDASYDFTLLRKSVDTATQHLLDAHSRAENIKSAYSLNKGRNVYGKTILLVDDIVTTGATINACARELYLNGASLVYGAFATVTRHNKDK